MTGHEVTPLLYSIPLNYERLRIMYDPYYVHLNDERTCKPWRQHSLRYSCFPANHKRTRRNVTEGTGSDYYVRPYLFWRGTCSSWRLYPILKGVDPEWLIPRRYQTNTGLPITGGFFIYLPSWFW